MADKRCTCFVGAFERHTVGQCTYKGKKATTKHPKPPPKVATPKEINSAFKKCGADVKTAFTVKDNNRANSTRMHINGPSPAQDTPVPPSQPQHVDPPSMSVPHSVEEEWESYEHLLFDVETEDKPEQDAVDGEWEDYESFFSSTHTNTEPSVSSNDNPNLNIAFANMSTDNLSSTTNETDSLTNTSTIISEHKPLTEGSSNQSNDAEQAWTYLHPAPPPLILTEAQRRDMLNCDEFDRVPNPPEPENEAHEEDTVSQLGASTIQGAETVVERDSVGVTVLRGELQRLQAENYVLRNNLPLAALLSIGCFYYPGRRDCSRARQRGCYGLARGIATLASGELCTT